MKRLLKVLNKVLEIKVNALILIFAGTVLVYAASKGTDGLWKFTSGDPISSTQINQNFEAVNVPSGAVMAFNLDNCPADKGWVLADGTNGTPDLRGVFVRGLDMGANRDPGRTRDGMIQNDAFQGHKHSFTSNAIVHVGGNFISGGGTSGTLNNASSQVLGAIDDVAYGTARVANETRPKNVALLYCVKK